MRFFFSLGQLPPRTVCPKGKERGGRAGVPLSGAPCVPRRGAASQPPGQTVPPRTQLSAPDSPSRQTSHTDGTHDWSCQAPEPDAHQLRVSRETGLCAASRLSTGWTLRSPAAPVPLEATCSHCRASHGVSPSGPSVHLPPSPHPQHQPSWKHLLTGVPRGGGVGTGGGQCTGGRKWIVRGELKKQTKSPQKADSSKQCFVALKFLIIAVVTDEL